MFCFLLITLLSLDWCCMVNASNMFHWLRPMQDGWLCADDIFRCALFNKYRTRLTLQWHRLATYDIDPLKPSVFMRRWPNRHQAIIYPTQRWLVVNWTPRNKLTQNSNQSAMVFMETCNKNYVCKGSSILSRPQCVKWSTAEGYNKTILVGTDLINLTGILQV